MKNKILLFISSFLTTFSLQAQEKTEQCGVELSEEFKFKYDEKFEHYFEEQLNLKQKGIATYYIPVVFHVIHAGDEIGHDSNVSDRQIYEVLQGLNDHYKNNHKHNDSSDTSIQFVLATKAPDGTCSTGINRIDYGHNSAYRTYGSAYSATDNGVDKTIIRNLSRWDPTKYYNIWIVRHISSSSGVAAYAYYPSEHGKAHDGTFISSRYVSYALSETLAHELGHSLNLMHTFQGSTGTNCPSQINGCGNDGDCISDTPPHTMKHTYDSNVTAFNSCSNNNDSSFKTNYMSYNSSTFKKVFTPMQITRMRSAINTYRSSFLPSNNNVFLMNEAPKANFRVDYDETSMKKIFCINTPIKLVNTSTCYLNTFTDTEVPNYTSYWEIKKNNQIVLTSKEVNPTISLSQIGYYDVQLTVTNNYGKSVSYKKDIIEILPSNISNSCAPNTTNKGNHNINIANVILNRINNTTEERKVEGYRDFSCSHITQAYSDQYNNLFIRPVYIGSPNKMFISGFIDYNNNGFYENNEQIFHQEVTWGSERKHILIPFIAPSNVVLDKPLRMRLVSDSSAITANKVNCLANFSYGDIEDYGVIFVQNLSNEEFNDSNIKLYPNPTNDFLNIELSNGDIKDLEVYDMAGKLIISKKISSKTYRLDIQYLSNGNYILKINNSSQKFIKQ